MSTFHKDRRSDKDRRSGRERRQTNDRRFEHPPDGRKGQKYDSVKSWRIIDLRCGKDRRSGQDRREPNVGKAN